MTSATAIFQNVSWVQSTIDDPAEGPSLNRASVRRSFQGALDGESSAELLFCPSSANNAGYVAMDRFVGRLGERQGSFVMQHGAPVEDGVPRPFGYIVPQSGTGELAGLYGEVRFSVDDQGRHSITLDYAFKEDR